VSYPQPGLSLDYSADNFAAWDQFGEVLNQAWKEGSSTVDGYSYTYDQSGNRLTRANLTDAALSESYSYDGLDRLTSVARNGTQTESWTLDSLGNFMDYTTPSVSQSRTTDAANEIQTITQNSTPSTQGYDAAGNMTTIADPNNPNGTLHCTYDAWNRLVQVNQGSASGPIIAQYQYDGSGRLVEELTNFSGTTPGTVTYSFYDGQNAIETRTVSVSGGFADVPIASSLSPQYQYVFSPMGGKTPILRDSTFDAESGAPTSAGRLYYTSDANTNVTALVDASGQVVERYAYSAYGTVTIYSADWSSTLGSSSVGNATLYASMVLDPRTGLFNDQWRWYDASVSTFVSRDPAMADRNLYRYCDNNPIIYVDPSGLNTCKGPKGKPNATTLVARLKNGCYWLIIADNTGDTDFFGGMGHSWMALVDTTVKPPVVTARGFGPVKRPDKLVDRVPGLVSDEDDTRYQAARAVPISKADYDAIMAKIKAKTGTPGSYQLRYDNCTTWVVEILHVVKKSLQVNEDSRTTAFNPGDPDSEHPFYSPESLLETLRNGDWGEGSQLFEN
jgi:RHS repeat-associated protein